MTPFEEYLVKSKEIRAAYAIRIAQDSTQKQRLEKKLKDTLAKLLDDAEAKEIERSKHL